MDTILIEKRAKAIAESGRYPRVRTFETMTATGREVMRRRARQALADETGADGRGGA